MGSIYKGLFQGRWLLQLNLVRNKHKHNISKPRLPPFERHVMEHVCVPYFLKKKKPQHVPDIHSCNAEAVVSKKSLFEPFFDMLAKEALDKVSNSKLVGFYHLNTFNNDDIFGAKVLLKKNGMKFVYYNKTVIAKAFTGTHYEPILQLFKNFTVMVTSAEFQLPKLLEVSKRMRKLTLMAALAEDRILSHSEIKYYGQYKNLDASRIKLLHTLNLASENLVHQINQHPNTLVQCLNQRADSLKNSSAAR